MTDGTGPPLPPPVPPPVPATPLSASSPGAPSARPVLRVGNCSGFYGDRLAAMREMLEGATTGTDGQAHHLDVVTGDYLAELTMLILGREALRDPSLGYARTFVHQVEDCLGLALEHGTRIVVNAGGVNPAGLAAKVREVARGLGLDPAVAQVEGDDLREQAAELGHPHAITTHAYLGGFGIARALEAGADVVVTGRVADASLVVGAAVAHFGWTPEDHDALAGAVVAGHVLECGTQATGGNFSGFTRLPQRHLPLGFPLAELGADGSCVITQHDGAGGAVTLDTVTAQLVYEIQSTRYLNPDVTTDLATVRLAQEGRDRVRISGTRGHAPPAQLKVCVNEVGGWRNSVELVLTGLELDAKEAWIHEQLDHRLVAQRVEWNRSSAPRADAESQEDASCLLRCTVLDPDQERVGKAFTGPVVELALASYPGFTLTGAPGKPAPYGIYRPAYVDRALVTHAVVLADGTREVVQDPTVLADEQDRPDECGRRPSPFLAPSDRLTRRMPLGTFVHARSGDKGGDANVGLWVAHDRGRPETYDARVTWLTKVMSPKKVRELVPEAADLDIDVYMLPNLGAVNVVIRGLLGDGVAASTRFDPQAKALGEWLRSRLVQIQEGLL